MRNIDMNEIRACTGRFVIAAAKNGASELTEITTEMVNALGEAMDEITKKVGEAMDEIAKKDRYISSLQSLLDAREAEIVALAKDAARYRWLRACHKDKMESLSHGLFCGCEHLDEAIDAQLGERP